MSLLGMSQAGTGLDHSNEGCVALNAAALSHAMGKYEQCGSPETVSHALNGKVRGNSTEAFSMVPVRVHGSGAVRLSDVLRTIELLENGVEVVDAFEFVKRLNTLRPNKLRQSD